MYKKPLFYLSVWITTLVSSDSRVYYDFICKQPYNCVLHHKNWSEQFLRGFFFAIASCIVLFNRNYLQCADTINKPTIRLICNDKNMQMRHYYCLCCGDQNRKAFFGIYDESSFIQSTHSLRTSCISNAILIRSEKLSYGGVQCTVHISMSTSTSTCFHGKRMCQTRLYKFSMK